MRSAAEFDVAIVGGSIAGCTAATFFAERGARVAVLEKASSLDHHKVMCTHYLQPSGVATLRRLGILGELEVRGAQRKGIDAWTRYGWIRYPRSEDEEHHPLCIRRRHLDPVLRERARSTPGVEYLAGHTLTDVVLDDGRVSGVVADTRDGGRRTITARLVVGADGRESRTARLANVPARLGPNDRFMYFAYYRDLEIPGPDQAKMWLLTPDLAYLFPNEDGLTLVGAFPSSGRMAEFRRDPEAAFAAYVAALPDEAPRLEDSKRVGKLMGKLDMTNRYRPPAARGMAFAGDAALASDPLWGIGCGWALQSAEWLVEETGDAVVTGRGLDDALRRYRRRHRRWFGPHHFLISDFSTGRPLNPLEKLLFAGAARDRTVARRVTQINERLDAPWGLLSPALLSRALRARMMTPT